jgi:inner membrane protein
MTHAVVGLALGRLFTARRMPRIWFWDALVILAILPDLDIISFRLGIPYEDILGHRGYTHSLFFALLVSLIAAIICYRHCQVRLWDLWGLFFAATASHGILDAFTNGGWGIAFFAPFDNQRYFFPWQPIEVSQLGYHFFLSSHAWLTLWSEFVWVILPTCGILAFVELVRKVRSRSLASSLPPVAAKQMETDSATNGTESGH